MRPNQLPISSMPYKSSPGADRTGHLCSSMASGPSWALPAGQGDLEDIWRALGSQFPPLPHFPCAYPALPCCGILPTPPLSLLAQPVSAPAPCELPGPALYWPLAPLAGPGEEASRAKAASAASRESTAALKAWLGRHRKNPYPSKGEKVLLALVSRMSLTQVSTWFANARRRLKKEHRAAWSPPDGPEEEESGPGPEGAAPGPGDSPGTQRRQRQPATETEPRKAKIWCLAELATGPQDGEGAPGLQH